MLYTYSTSLIKIIRIKIIPIALTLHKLIAIVGMISIRLRTVHKGFDKSMVFTLNRKTFI